MSPAEKAKELYDKYDTLLGENAYDFQQSLTKQCVLICVAEVQNSGACEYEHTDNYWRAVKIEIEKL